jgi:hypothetical protein
MTSPRWSSRRATSPGRVRRGVVAAAVGALVAVPLAGCDLRWETPPPTVPVADEAESVRQRTTADALSLGVLAERAAAVAADPGVAAVATEVGLAADAHLEALGGIYVPFPSSSTPATGATAAPSATASPAPTDPGPTATETASPTPPAADPVQAATELVDLLTETAASARADAGAVADGRLARLLAAVAANRLLLAESLAAAAGLPAPVGAPTDATEGGTAPGVFVVPESVPTGVSEADVATLVQSEDAVGLAYEVVAARSADEARARSAARATEHRDHAQAWAEAAEIAGTGLDPRRTSYALAPVLTDPAGDPAAVTAELARLEGDLAVTYASLVPQAEPGSRTPLVDALVAATREHARLSGVTPVFPGLPEQTA